MEHPDPRRMALEALDALADGHRTLDRVIEQMHGRFPDLTRKDRSLFNALSYGVVRWRSRLDWVIGRYSKTRPDRVDPGVRNILRLALFQMIFLDKIPDAAAVNTAVELSKSVAPPWVVGYVNGVLRNAARGYRNLVLPEPAAKDPTAALAVRYALPRWLVRKWLKRFGSDAAALFESVNTIAPVTVRVNTLKTTRKALTEAMESQADRVCPTVYAADGLSLAGLHTAVSDMPAFRNGWFQVQDEAAQLVSMFLAPQPGETVLDACAGLGGKTGHLAQLMRNRGKIIACDRSRDKLDKLQSAMHRLGAASVTVCRADLSRPVEKLAGTRFDRILLDAPCSGLGVLRRNPDTKWRTERRDLASYARRQSLFLHRLSERVRPSGIIVYAVCSFEPEENEAVLKDFLNKHPEFVMDTGYPKPFSGSEVLVDQSGCLRTFPHTHGTDGFFAARLRRIR